MYSIVFIRSAEKELEKLPNAVFKKISPEIDKLATNPRPHGVKKLKGNREHLWRIRVGDYRVIYSIEDVVKIVEIRKIGNRRDVYEV
jgi:mRNA interferase RelE/StbE